MVGMTVQQYVRNRDDGFSLIEVLVAMIVVVPAVIGAAGMVTLAAIVHDANRIAEALFLPLGNLFWGALIVFAAAEVLGVLS